MEIPIQPSKFIVKAADGETPADLLAKYNALNQQTICERMDLTPMPDGRHWEVKLSWRPLEFIDRKGGVRCGR